MLKYCDIKIDFLNMIERFGLGVIKNEGKCK